MGKNTLYITFDGLTDPLGQSQILPYLCGIAKNGYQITILSCEKEDRLAKEKSEVVKIIGQLPITWHSIIYSQSGGFVSRFLYIRRLLVLANTMCREKTISLVHCRSYLAALIGLSLKLKRRIPFVFDMRGFWADERVDGGIWKKTNLLHRFFYFYFKKKEKRFIQQADALVSLTEAGLRELNKTNPGSGLNNKTTIIPCCVNTQLFNMEAGAVPLPGLNIKPSNHLIIYTGSIGTWYYTKEMIDCMVIWKKFIPEIKLLILTKDQEEASKIINHYSEEQRAIVILAQAAYKEVTNYLSLAKAAIFFIKPSYSKIASSPTKMAECWAMGLPIISNTGIGDNDLFFSKYDGGILLNEFTDAAYEAACKKYLALQTNKHHYREIALNYFDTNMAIKKYTGIYNSLTSQN